MLNINTSAIKPYIRLTRLDKPIGTLLLLWPTLWALWLSADGLPDPDIVVLFILGVFVMRSAGCVINDYADRNFDAHVERTHKRPLVSNEISIRQALITYVILLIIAFVIVLQFNMLTIKLSIIGVVLASFYPFCKRYTHLPQAVLGLAFGWGIPMAYAATLNSTPPTVWLLYAANAAWVIAYDTQYAMVDRDDDLKAGIKSSAILFDRYDNLIISLLYTISLLILIGIGIYHFLSWHYFAACSIAACIAAWQQIICRNRERDLYFKAFLNNNWFGAAIFIGIVLALLSGYS